MKGLITDTDFKKRILNKFISKFVKNDYTFKNPKTGGIKLIWCNFSEECKIYPTDKLFSNSTKAQQEFDTPVYFYNERTQEMFFTDFEDISNFVNNFEPWDEIDAEIFDESLDWVIAVTHEDVSFVSGLSVAIDEYVYDGNTAK